MPGKGAAEEMKVHLQSSVLFCAANNNSVNNKRLLPVKFVLATAFFLYYTHGSNEENTEDAAEGCGQETGEKRQCGRAEEQAGMRPGRTTYGTDHQNRTS